MSLRHYNAIVITIQETAFQSEVAFSLKMCRKLNNSIGNFQSCRNLMVLSG